MKRLCLGGRRVEGIHACVYVQVPYTCLAEPFIFCSSCSLCEYVLVVIDTILA